MSDDILIICSNCGEEVPLARYCPKCGSMLEVTPIQEVDEQLKRAKEIKKILTNFKNTTAKVLSSNINQALDDLIKHVTNLVSKFNYQKKFLSEKDITNTICFSCSKEVQRQKFCSECGKPLAEHIEDEHKSIINYISFIEKILTTLQNMVEKIISNEAFASLVGVSHLLMQIKKRYQIKLQATITPTPKPTKKIAEKPTITEPQIIVDKEKPDTLWSRFEKNLLNYWFFYLAIILLSVGICLTLFYVVVNITNEASKMAIIYAIGVGIVLIGQIIAIFTRKRVGKKIDDKKKLLKDELKETASKERFGFLHQMTVVIMFIGSVVITTGNVIGMASTLSVPTGLFLYLGYGISLLTIGLGLLNNSEMIVLTGILQTLLYSCIDLLWGQAQNVLNEITSLIAFVVPIIIIVLLAVFFKKWTGSLVVTSVLSVMLCFPQINQNVGLECIILFLIPIMMILVIIFSSEKIHTPYKQSMAVLSMIFPAITLIVISFTNKFMTSASLEPAWGQLYSYEIFLTSLAILGVAYFYPFIQEKHLEMDENNKFLKIFGQLIIGAVAIIAVAVYRENFGDTITTILFFLTYFAFGIVSSLTFIEKETSIESSILSFSISEILAIVLLALKRQALTTADQSLLFIIGVVFIILAYMSLLIPKAFFNSESLYITCAILSGVNIILIGHITALNTWLVFALLLAFVIGSLFVNIPRLIPQIKNWRALSIMTILTNAVVISIFAFTSRYVAFNFEALVIFILFIVVSIPAFFEWKKTKEVTTHE
ncbi:MAG: hypothetical protein FK730_04500 [Asgard group archaeon]|nr:hypothetical protein [Asgard group archaeon]